MRSVHTTSKTWYKVLYQHTMYVISLLNISIKTYYNRRIKINKFGQYSQEDYILSMTSRYFLQFLSPITVWLFPVSLYNRLTTPFLRNVDLTVAANIEPMSLEMRIWPWIRDTKHEWINIKQSHWLRCLHWKVFSHITMIWCHDKVVQQRRSCAMLCHSFITTVWWYNILYQTDYFR
jgi:hypothetical protein